MKHTLKLLTNEIELLNEKLKQYRKENRELLDVVGSLKSENEQLKMDLFKLSNFKTENETRLTETIEVLTEELNNLKQHG
jgi:ribosomal protein S15P/S13E